MWKTAYDIITWRIIYERIMSVICNNILPNIHTRRKSAEMTAFFLYCPFSYTSRAGAGMEWDIKMSPGFPAGTWTQCNPLALWYPTLILQNCTSLGRNNNYYSGQSVTCFGADGKSLCFWTPGSSRDLLNVISRVIVHESRFPQRPQN